MLYKEVLPRVELAPYVKCFWILEDPNCLSTSVQRIVPDGRMELIFHYGNRFERIGDGGSFVQPRSLITGQIRNPVLVRPTGPIGMLAVRFSPYGFSSLFPHPSHELSGALNSCEDVLGRSGNELEEQVLSGPSNAQRIQIIEDYLVKLLKARGNHDFRVHRVTQKIYEQGGIFHSENLAQEFNFSSRQLERLFRNKVGTTPGVFGRIIRFQKAIRFKLDKPTLSLTDLSHAVGYYDQSHFIKDFKEFSGLSPKRYFSEVHEMADFFTDNL